MTNDTNTLTGALSKLGETLADNLVSMGVSDADASDGLTTLANKVLDISPSVGGIELDTSITLDESNLEVDYVEGQKVYRILNNQLLTLYATLNAVYDDTVVDMKGVLQGATVDYSLDSIGGTVDSAITDNDGLCSMSAYPSTLQEDYAYMVTMSYDGTGTDYKSCDEQFWFMLSKYLFYDGCNKDNTSQYTDVTIDRSSNTITKSYDSTEQAYQIFGTGGDYFRGLLIPNITGEDNIRISITVKLATTSAYNQLFIGCTDNIAQTSSSWTGDYFRIRGDNKSDYLHNSWTEVSGSSSTTSVANKYVTVVFEKNGTTANCKVYDTDSTTVLRTYTYNSMNTYTNPYYVFGMNTRYSTDIKYIKEIKVETVD